MLIAGFRSQRDLLRATVIVADVLYNGGDAVRFELEHSEGPVITVFVPYTKKRFGRGVEYADMAVTLGTHQVWNR